MNENYLSGALGSSVAKILELRLATLTPVPTPAAGAEFTTKVPGGVIWELIGASWLFTTNANVANRVPSLSIADADNNQIYRFGNGNAVAAASVVRVSFTQGLGTAIAGVSYASSLPTPALPLSPGWSIASATSLIDAGDAITQVKLYVRAWSETDVAQEIVEIVETLESVTSRLIS